MSTTLDKQLKGSNFCWMDCSERKAVIHPETCVKQVKITDNSGSTLEDWILRTSNNDEITDSMSSYTGLLNWLQTNYPVSGGSSTVAPATPTTLGVIKTGENNPYLNLSNGVLTFNTDNLPTAAIGRLGNIKMGTSSIIQIPFSLNETDDLTNVRFPIDLGDSVHYAFPLRYDNNGRTGIAIPKSVFTDILVQPDWEVDDNTNPAYIKNKPVLATVATSGRYSDLERTPRSFNYVRDDDSIIEGEIATNLDYQIQLRQGYDRYSYITTAPINIDIISPVRASTMKNLFSTINRALSILYSKVNYCVYCELNIKFAMLSGSANLYELNLLLANNNVICINNTITNDTLTNVLYQLNEEDNNYYLKMEFDNSESTSIKDCNLNIVLSRVYAGNDSYVWQVKINCTTLPYEQVFLS